MNTMLPCLFAVFCISIGIATEQTVSTALQVEAIEICHRNGGTVSTCGELPR
jgi:hypothetical protein